MRVPLHVLSSVEEQHFISGRCTDMMSNTDHYCTCANESVIPLIGYCAVDNF